MFDASEFLRSQRDVNVFQIIAFNLVGLFSVLRIKSPVLI